MIEIIISTGTFIDPIFLAKTLNREKKIDLNAESLSGLPIQNEKGQKAYDIALVLPMDSISEVLKTLENLRKMPQSPKTIVIIKDLNQNNLQLIEAQDVEGIVMADSLKEKLVDAIALVYSGKKYRDHSVSVTNNETISDHNKSVITDREKEIIGFIAKGFTSKEIAKKLFVSEHTVKSHRKNINQKLDVHNPAQLVRYAIENNL